MTLGDITREVLEAQHAAVVRGQVAHDGIAEFLGGAFGELAGVVGRQGREVRGAPYARYGMREDGGWDVEAGFPVDAPIAEEGRVQGGGLPGGPVATVLYRGDYGGVAQAYDAVVAWLEGQDERVTDTPWECYLDGPEVPEPRTRVVVPCGPTR